jgi:hypothetical protein
MNDRLDQADLDYLLRNLKPSAGAAPTRTRSLPAARALPRQKGDAPDYYRRQDGVCLA